MEKISVVNRHIDDYLKAVVAFSDHTKSSLPALINQDSLELQSSGRVLQFVDPPGEDVVMTTYFTSKPDPQRNVTVTPGNFDYIAAWYKSVKHLALKALIFTDFVDEFFFERFTTPNVKFVPCTLGNYSLNDERYFIFYSYMLRYHDKLQRVFLTDVNDVILLKSPFELVSVSDPFSLFVGRNHTSRILYSEINRRRLDYIKSNFGVSFPGSFYLMPVYNAGIIGGNRDVILYFLSLMCCLLKRFSSSANLNMIVLNIVIYQHFCPHVAVDTVGNLIRSKLPFRVVELFEKVKMLLTGKSWNEMKDVNHMNDIIGNTKVIRTSYPLHNAYKSYKVCEGEYIMHK